MFRLVVHVYVFMQAGMMCVYFVQAMVTLAVRSGWENTRIGIMYKGCLVSGAAYCSQSHPKRSCRIRLVSATYIH